MQQHAAQVAGYRPSADLLPAHWQAGDVEASDGTRLHYTRTGGDKPVLLLLHGIFGAGLTWLRIARALEADYDVIMPDARGHGLSGRMTGAYRLQDDIADLIRALNLERPVVIGHSMGAETAGWFAAEYPDLLRALVLAEPPLNSSPTPDRTDEAIPEGVQPLLDRLAAMATQPHHERLLTMLNIIPPGTTLALWQEADYVTCMDGVIQFDPNFLRYGGSGNLIDVPETIARIACPLLLMSSRASVMPDMTLARGIDIFKTHWRNGQHVHFPDSGHYIQYEAFDRFMAAVREFLRQKK